MLKNEVGNDGAATAVEAKTAGNALRDEFISDSSNSSNWVKVGGAALVVGGATLAAAAVMKYARPAVEVGKAAEPLVQEIVPSLLKGAALPRAGETGILGVVRNGRVEANLDALASHSIPIGSPAGRIEAATKTIVRDHKPIGGEADNAYFADPGSWPTFRPAGSPLKEMSPSDRTAQALRIEEMLAHEIPRGAAGVGRRIQPTTELEAAMQGLLAETKGGAGKVAEAERLAMAGKTAPPIKITKT